MSAKYDTVLNRCFEKFRFYSQYKNDERLVEVYLKAVRNLIPVKRADLIQDAVTREFGTHVSKMYLAMSNIYQAVENYQEASKVLQKGIQVGAQPVEYLEDELKNLQYRVRERIAKKTHDGNYEPLRNFGMSVPVCHLTNEAQNIRVALSPSKQCRARPVQQKITPKVPIFQGFDENMDTDMKKSLEQAEKRKAELPVALHHNYSNEVNLDNNQRRNRVESPSSSPEILEIVPREQPTRPQLPSTSRQHNGFQQPAQRKMVFLDQLPETHMKDAAAKATQDTGKGVPEHLRGSVEKVLIKLQKIIASVPKDDG